MDEFLGNNYLFNQNDDEEKADGEPEEEESKEIGEDLEENDEEKEKEEFLSPDDGDSSVSGDEF